MIPKVSIDMIMSDPLMIVGGVLIVVGAIVFLVAFIKFITYRSEYQPFIVPHEEPTEELASDRSESEIPAPPPLPEVTTSSVIQEVNDVIKETLSSEQDNDKTVVMSAHDTDIQIQFDVVVSQIKTLNKKVSELEDRLEQVGPSTAAGDPNQIVAANNEISQKLLKLAEHVIILEREVAKLKSTKPPVMPI